CTFEEVSQVAHQLKLVCNLLVQKSNDKAEVRRLQLRTVMEFIVECDTAVMELEKHAELWLLKVSLVVEILGLVKQSILRKDYMFHDVDKRFREEIPEGVWLQLLDVVGEEEVLFDRLADDLADWQVRHTYFFICSPTQGHGCRSTTRN